MNEKPCPLCGRDMTAIEVHAGRGELYCVHCDLVIGGNESKTPDELMELLGQKTCKRVFYEPTGVYVCSECGLGLSKKLDKYCFLRFCPNCGRKVVDE